MVKNGLSQAVFLARGCPQFAGCSVLSGVSNTRSALLCPTKLGPWSHDSGTPPPLRQLRRGRRFSGGWWRCPPRRSSPLSQPVYVGPHRSTPVPRREEGETVRVVARYRREELIREAKSGVLQAVNHVTRPLFVGYTCIQGPDRSGCSRWR